MTHLYEVHLSSGQVYDVSTEHHHDDHPGDAFRNHLLDILKRTTSQVASAVILKVIFKGRR